MSKDRESFANAVLKLRTLCEELSEQGLAAYGWDDGSIYLRTKSLKAEDYMNSLIYEDPSLYEKERKSN